MDGYVQDQRLLQVDTKLGINHFLLTAFDGREALSGPFAYDIELASVDFSVTPNDMLGTPVTICVRDPAGAGWTGNGIVSRFAVTARHSTRTFCNYRARLVPSLWLLTRTSDCRIFQDQTVRQIVETLLAEHGIEQRVWKLTGQYQNRDYCVQYRETAYDFICRLLEEEGIYFYFLHDANSHTVVFADSNRGLYQCAKSPVALVPGPGDTGGVWSWQNTYRFRSSLWSLSDFNFETPSTSLAVQSKTVNKTLGKSTFERFDYPGRYTASSAGDERARLRMEYEEAAYQDVVGEGGCVGFGAGAAFALSNSSVSSSGVEYFLTDVHHVAQDHTHLSQDAAPATYLNHFQCRPCTIPYRPPIKTPVPRIHGAQTAIVTGQAGSEICTDNYGRIKVQFHWDRRGKNDDQSSCWIRVAQSWAGAGWGTWFVPRIGQEVVVAFLDGDPDRPLVVGSVYNAAQPVPFPLPGNATQSGLRTRSSMGGSAANCNELRFEDKKGGEQVYLHAERNMDSSVELDETHLVGHDQSITIQNNRTKSVVNNETTTIGANRTETVMQTESVSVVLSRTHTIGTIDTLTVGAARIHAVGATEAITIGQSQSLGVGTSQSIDIGTSQATNVGSDQQITVGNNQTVSVGTDRSTTIGQNEGLSAGKQINISAGDQIVLSTGSASITMKNGDITIEGKQITIKGKCGDVIIKGQKILQN